MSDYWINCNFACFGLTVDKFGVVIDAAPIARWTLGSTLGFVLKYYRKQRVLIEYKRIKP